jgi:hypothetical protein
MTDDLQDFVQKYLFFKDRPCAAIWARCSLLLLLELTTHLVYPLKVSLPALTPFPTGCSPNYLCSPCSSRCLYYSTSLSGDMNPSTDTLCLHSTCIDKVCDGHGCPRAVPADADLAIISICAICMPPLFAIYCQYWLEQYPIIDI